MVQNRTITIISLCKYRLSEEEYVRPLVEIFSKIGKTRVIHYKSINNAEPNGDIVILSGTALKDFDYFNYLNKFQWLKTTNKKVIGICAGAQIIIKLFGGKLKEKKIIGIRTVKSIFGEFQSYFLTSYIPVLNENFEILGIIEDSPAIFKVKNKKIYGFVFHPEVLNIKTLLKIATNNFI